MAGVMAQGAPRLALGVPPTTTCCRRVTIRIILTLRITQIAEARPEFMTQEVLATIPAVVGDERPAGGLLSAH
jgi:hypothetical protein